jgi:hypothetical protein
MLLPLSLPLWWRHVDWKLGDANFGDKDWNALACCWQRINLLR